MVPFVFHCKVDISVLAVKVGQEFGDVKGIFEKKEGVIYVTLVE